MGISSILMDLGMLVSIHPDTITAMVLPDALLQLTGM